MELHCLIIDDEPLARQLLADYVHKTPGLSLCEAFADPIQALYFLENNPAAVQLVLLDIQMPELSGLQFMKILRGRYAVVLTTAYEQYALHGFDLDAVDYLLKPISLARFLQAIDKVKKQLATPGQTTPLPTVPELDHVFVKSGAQTLRINLHDIHYLQGMGDYVAIHTPAGKILTLENLGHLAATLPPHRFVRIHRSYLVALRHIDLIERSRVVVAGVRLPIGPSYEAAFWSAIHRAGRGS